MKRQRVGSFQSGTVVVQRSAKRSLDKQIIISNQTVSTTQVATTLYTATFPGTITGLRWDLGTVSLQAASSPNLVWALVVLKEGVTASNLSYSNGSTLYAPEQDVMAWGATYVLDSDATGGPMTRNFTDKTKAMRKLQCGDSLVLLANSNVLNSVGMMGAVQFFYKTG